VAGHQHAAHDRSAEQQRGKPADAKVAYLAQVVWHSIAAVVTAARKAMDWLQKVARIAAKHQLPLKWTTPSGFVAYQAYRDVKLRQVKARLQGSLVYLAQNERSKKIDARKQALGGR
jgi:DNA-directed RNA polymerase